MGDTTTPYDYCSGATVQDLGTVQTPDGRLVTLPSAVHHKVAPCTLLDGSPPGRRRFLHLHLVDPHYRVASTRNVPPQQRDWLAAASWGRIDWTALVPGVSVGVPPEIVRLIIRDVYENENILDDRKEEEEATKNTLNTR